MALARVRHSALLLVAVFMICSSTSAGAGDPLAAIRSQSLHVGAGAGAAPGKLDAATGGYPDALPRYHIASQLVCTDCHITHASQQHAVDPGNPGPHPIPYDGGANRWLLRKSDPLDLCLTCHDGRGFAPDVVTADANGLVQRSAGFFAEPGMINMNGHDLGRDLPREEGFGLCVRCHWEPGENTKVTCIDCHNPHGNNVARNLQWASYPSGTPDLGLFVNPAALGMDRYEAANVAFGTLNSPMLREASNMCIDCHHTFSGGYYVDPDGDGIHSRHPAYESERNSRNSIDQGAAKESTAPGHWEGGTGSGFGATPRVRFVNSGATDFASSRVVDASTNGVFCLSCHKAHGSDQAFGMVWQLQNGVGPSGCDQCHLIANVGNP
jgi:hypothetical protein